MKLIIGKLNPLDISKYGKITITNNNIMVEDFHFKSTDGSGTLNIDGMEAVIEWAIKRLRGKL